MFYEKENVTQNNYKNIVDYREIPRLSVTSKVSESDDINSDAYKCNYDSNHSGECEDDFTQGDIETNTSSGTYLHHHFMLTIHY